METYKIKSISHSGRKGNRGTKRTDGRYPLRIGRTVKIDLQNLVEGTPLILSYVKDEEGVITADIICSVQGFRVFILYPKNHLLWKPIIQFMSLKKKARKIKWQKQLRRSKVLTRI